MGEQMNIETNLCIDLRYAQLNYAFIVDDFVAIAVIGSVGKVLRTMQLLKIVIADNTIPMPCR